MNKRRARATAKKSQLRPPLAPMEAESVDEIPTGPEWQYEPKWDGFRCLAFRRGTKIELQSKAGQPLARYFPEIIEQLFKLRSQHFVLDGELVIPRGDRLSFNDLLMRIHPAASRVQKLAHETPALYVVFDLLEDEKHGSLLNSPLTERRKLLEEFAKREFTRAARLALSPATRDINQARRWFKSAGVSLDGVIAKRVDLEYRSGDRTGMQKIKPIRTADCVVGGFRYASTKDVANFDGTAKPSKRASSRKARKFVGSLLLGLYNDEGLLDHVGFTSSFKHADRPALTKKLEQLVATPGFTGSAPGGPSRWSTKRSVEWQPLKPKLVVEVAYDHFTGGRFRHGTTLLRWRPDKAPRQCTLDQVAKTGGGQLKLLKK